MKANLGGGPGWKHPGWANIDIGLGWDLSKGLPPSTGELDLVYTSHCLEHLTFLNAVKVLEQVRERLTGGIRIVVPDMDIMSRWIADGNAMQNFVRDNPTYYMSRQHMGYQRHIADLAAMNTSIGHLTAFTYSILHVVLDCLGYKDIQRVDYCKSRWSELEEAATLDGNGMPTKGFDNVNTRTISVFVEAGV